MHMVIVGGTGFIGRPLCQRLLDQGHRVTLVTRDPMATRGLVDAKIGVVGWQGDRDVSNEMAETLRHSQVVINLAGAPVADRRWTSRTKTLLHTSRVGPTTSLISALAQLSEKPAHLVSGSAIGYYGPRGEEPLTEEGSPGTGFLAGLCRDWEGAATAGERLGIRITLLRIGVVMGKNGGALGKMLPPFRIGLGGPLGTGSQWISWIHLEDLIELIVFVVTQGVSGPVNATAPHPVTNRDFARTLGQILGKPARIPAPAFLLKMVLGQMAEELLLTGQRVLPARAQAMGFRFRYPTLPEALRVLLS